MNPEDQDMSMNDKNRCINPSFYNLKEKVKPKKLAVKIPVNVDPFLINLSSNSGNMDEENPRKGSSFESRDPALVGLSKRSESGTILDEDAFPKPSYRPKKDSNMMEEERPYDANNNNAPTFEATFNIIPHLERISTLGQGSSGIVEKTLYRPANLIVALKSIPLNSDETFKKQLKSEIETLRNCKSPYIVTCYGSDYRQGTINIALEYMDIGSLADVLKAVGKIPEVILGMIVYQVLKGLEYLHKGLKVIHRDIKPSNLLVNSEGQVKIADFGVSGKLIHTNDQKTSWVGTIAYMSPERFKGEQYTSDTDIWSLGLTILECALGRFPYPPEENASMGFLELMDYINIKPVPKLPENFSEKIVDFVSICLRKEPGKRSSANELLEHRWIKQYENISNQSFKEWLKVTKMSSF